MYDLLSLDQLLFFGKEGTKSRHIFSYNYKNIIAERAVATIVHQMEWVAYLLCLD